MAIPRTRPSAYPAVLSYGFRPFFLLGSLYAGAAILFWLPLFYGQITTSSVFLPVDWHVHEMLFGYLAAIMTGFLLTAIPNWTGRLPVQGLPLLALVLLWLAGRLAVFFSADIGWVVGAVVDCAFLLAVAAAASTEIIAGRNWRNLKVLLPVAVLLAANVMFHAEAHYHGISDVSRRLGLGAAVVLIMIIGGRVVPSFTRNWLARENQGRLPSPFSHFDAATIALSATALGAWAFFPESNVTGAMLISGAVLNVMRLARWAGDRTLRDPLVLILHVAFVFVPIGFLLAGLAVVLPETVPSAAGIHAFSVGAVACMTLAVMTRATLGHTGRELRAGIGTCAVFVAIVLAAILRIGAAFVPAEEVLLHMSATLWVVAFLGYAALFGGMLVQPKLRARQPNKAAS
ncbi:NnrS family protein [Mesorhizobium sp. Root172]|uniref:NnrS family protein n=1 Tax=Mesorhizobium sp. Root172 TaxID=1736481 RepID=UPI0006FE4DC8|nr:NnrS family protein [Mesorhizobium sp. Root172]KRB30889.1 short-chain dehydrogenase [Mesorhizobium sp. Root172]